MVSTIPTPTLNFTTAGLNLTVHVNASGYITDDEPDEIGFSELQTVGIACVATLIPLSLSLIAVFGFRMAWKSWRRSGEDRTLRRTDSSDPNKSSHLLLPDEIKTSESQFSVIPAEELEEVMTTYSAPSDNSNNHNHTRKSTANGSIITMTMKNNHLIVETEERILGVSDIPCTPNLLEELPTDDDSTALVHHSQEVQESFNTGLSQSDLSMSSSGSANPGYCYGNQLEYLGDERDVPQVVAIATVRTKHVPFTVQPSQDIEDDDLYLEQQHQLGNGVDDSQTVPDVFPQHCNPYEAPVFGASSEQPQVNPIS